MMYVFGFVSGFLAAVIVLVVLACLRINGGGKK